MSQGENVYVSTGALPSRSAMRALVVAAHEQFRRVDEGKLADYIPALAEADAAWFGICVADTHGDTFAVGDADFQRRCNATIEAFSLQSVSKPFILALVCDRLGADEVASRLGVDATGLAFDSVMAVELRPDHTTNPLVNSGAIATTSLVAGATAAERWDNVRSGLSRFAGRTLELDSRVYESEAAHNQRNAGIAHLLRGYGRV